MSTSNDDIVLVAFLRRRNDIRSNSVFNERLNANVGNDLVPGRDAGDKRLSVDPRDISAGNVRSFGATGCTECARDGLSVEIVVNYGTDSTGTSSVSDLQPEVACSSEDECNLALDSGREIGLKKGGYEYRGEGQSIPEPTELHPKSFTTTTDSVTSPEGLYPNPLVKYSFPSAKNCAFASEYE